MSDHLKFMVERTFASSAGDSILMKVNYPEVASDGDWLCGHSIKWNEEPEIIKLAPGIDALDALLRSVEMARARLETQAERSALSLSWDGNSDLGFGY